MKSTQVAEIKSSVLLFKLYLVLTIKIPGYESEDSPPPPSFWIIALSIEGKTSKIRLCPQRVH